MKILPTQFEGQDIRQVDDTAGVTICQSDTGAVEVRLDRDTVWLRQDQMADLFGRERSVITKHLRNVFAEGELAEEAMCKIYTLLDPISQ